jgi:hypothetical protein
MNFNNANGAGLQFPRQRGILPAGVAIGHIGELR